MFNNISKEEDALHSLKNGNTIAVKGADKSSGFLFGTGKITQKKRKNNCQMKKSIKR